MIKTLSPYYVSVPLISPNSSEICSQYTIKIYIWSGNKSAVPSEATYEKTKINAAGLDTTDKVNIARIVNDFIDFTCTQSIVTSLEDGNNQSWVKLEVYYATTDESDDDLAQLVQTVLATKGYGYFLEGENPQIPANKILLEGDEFKVNRTGFFVLPIYADEVTTSNVTVKSYPINEIDYTISVPGTEYSNELVQYLWVNISEAANDEYIEIVYNSIITTILITDECRYTPIDICFQNKEGAIQLLTFFKKKTDSMQLESEKYEGNRDIGEHQFIKFNINSVSKFSINSGYMDEDKNETIKQLLRSERVWQLSASVEIPLNISTSSFETKTRQNDRLINYAIEFEYAFNDINNV